MFGLHYNTVIVLIGGGLLCASTGLVGCFATLRRRALTGDALAHAAFPGICLAFLIWGDRSLPALLLGAFVVGLLGVGVISLLRAGTRVREDSAIGIVLSVAFGVGIVLKVGIQNRTGGGNKAGLDSFIFGQIASMTAQDVYLIAGLALLSLVLIGVLYKECKLVVFDAAFAQAQGWPALALDLLLMGLLTLTVVVALRVAGIVMASALLIVPCVTARFWTDRFSYVLLLAMLCGLAMGLVGVGVSAQYAVPTGPVIVLVGAALFLLSLILAPRRGLVGRWLAEWRFRKELNERKLLGILYNFAEPALPDVKPVLLAELLAQRSWSRRQLRELLRDLERAGLVAQTGGACHLTAAGLQRAATVARGQRLWHLFLNEYADLASGTGIMATESVETLLPPNIVQELRAKLQASGRMPAETA